MACQNSSATPTVAAVPQVQVRRLMAVPKKRRLQIGVQNTISANITATRPETTCCSAWYVQIYEMPKVRPPCSAIQRCVRQGRLRRSRRTRHTANSAAAARKKR